MSTQATGTVSIVRRTTKGPGIFTWAAIGLGVAACLAFVLMGSVSIFGHVTGQELSPYDFQRRNFVYFEIPLIHLQITPIDRSTSTGTLEKHLVDNQFLEPAGADATSAPDAPDAAGSASASTGSEDAEPERWDLIETRQSEAVVSVGDARILCQYLDSKSDDGTQYWLAWTESHDELARAVWPLVGRLAVQRMYIFIPEVLEAARSATNSDQYLSEINDVLADRFHQLALAQQQQQRHQVALDLIGDGLSYAPEHEGLLAAQKVSQSALEPTSP